MMSDLYIRFRSLFRRAKMNEELDNELRFHLEHQMEQYLQAGMSPEEAMRQARMEFGGFAQVQEECREARGVAFLETLVQDVRFGLRMLGKSPGFTVVVVLTLALGIGANTAIFTFVNAVMLSSLPVSDPQRLVVAEWSARNRPHHLGTSSFGDCQDYHGMRSDCSLSYPMFQQIRDQKNLFANAMAFAGPVQLDLSGNGAATMAQGELVSGSYFETLGVRAALGRTLESEDEKPGAEPVVVLDYGYWKRAFGGSPTVIGRTIRLNNSAFTIVGVADSRFTRLTPGKSVDLWVVLTQGTQLGQAWTHRSDVNNWWLVVVGRLQSGVSRTQAQAAVDALFVNNVLHGTKPVWTSADDPHLWLLPAQQGLTGIRYKYGKPLMLLMAAVGIVLLIACANIAGLMLARSAAREREMATRLALGAGRQRVIRQLLTESLLLSFLGSVLGALLAYAGTAGLEAFFSKNAYSPLRLDLEPNVPVLLFAIGMAVLTGIGFGLAPALCGARANVAKELKGNTVSATGHRMGHRLSLGKWLVVMQVALSMVVLAGAGLLLRTLNKLHSIDPGFDTSNILLFSINPELVGYNKEQISALYANLQARLAALPGVVNSSYSSGAILDGGLSTMDMRVEGHADKNTVEPQILSVGPDYFETMKIPVVDGRVLAKSDMSNTQLAAVVNREFVRKFADGRNPIGLHFGGPDPKDPQWQIVGVVGDTKYESLRAAKGPTAYVPLTAGGATFALRTAISPAGLMPAVRNLVHAVDNNLPIVLMRTQSDAVDRLLFNERLVARLFGLFGALGLMLACVGLYGLLSYDVTLRTREIGIRTALGAQRRDVLLLVLRQGLVLVIVGVTLGAASAIGVTRLLESLLYGVRPTDPFTFMLTAALLIAIGLIACSLPARRATRVDPMTALRCE
ncbi:MAG: ABC transporter permease [Acidobacteriaceae bacterium]